MIVRRALVTSVCVALAGCGGGGTDADGFSAGDRKAAQARLDQLRQTSIPTALVQITGVARKVPEVCRVHLADPGSETFKLFLFWAPDDPRDKSATYTWFEATLREASELDKFHIGYEDQTVPKAQVLKAHSGPVFAKPSKRCQVLMNGHLRLLDE
jgi:hypothetical protein